MGQALRVIDFPLVVMGARFKQVTFSLVVFVLAAEAGSFLIVKYLQHRGILYKPHEDLSDYENYLDRRHPVLGWVELTDDDSVLPNGARYSPAVPDGETHPPCVSLYGDSFVWADEVDDAHAWGNLLADRLGCRVANFGVRAYGTDQSYLRYLHSTPTDNGHVVVLGHLTENVLRNVTQDFDLLYGLTKYGLKPRFILDAAGQLELVPLPELSSEEFALLNRSPENVLTHEYLEPLYARFPYVVSLVQTFGSYRIQAKLRGEPSYAAFYRSHHPSNALAITAGILSAFVDEAKARTDKPLVLVIPHLKDLRYFEANGTWVQNPLLAELERREIPFLDAGPDILATLQGRDSQSIYASRSHLNEEGNRLLADIVYNALVARGLTPLQATTGVTRMNNHGP